MTTQGRFVAASFWFITGENLPDYPFGSAVKSVDRSDPMDHDAGQEAGDDRYGYDAGDDQLGHDVMQDGFFFFIGPAAGPGYFQRNEVGSGEAEESRDGHGDGESPVEMDDPADDDSDDRAADCTDGQDDQQWCNHAEEHVWCRVGQADENQGDGTSHDESQGIGLCQAVFFQKAQFMQDDAEDEAEDEDADARSLGQEHGNIGNEAEFTEDDIGRTVFFRDVKQTKVQMLFCFPASKCAIVEFRADPVSFFFAEKAGNGDANEILEHQDQYGKDFDIWASQDISYGGHDQIGDDSAGQNRGAYQGVIGVDEQTADKEDATGYGKGSKEGDEDGLPFFDEIIDLDGRTDMDEKHAECNLGKGDEARIGKNRLGQAQPETGRENDGTGQQHRDEGLCLVGDEISDGINEEDQAEGNQGIHSNNSFL